MTSKRHLRFLSVIALSALLLVGCASTSKTATALPSRVYHVQSGDTGLKIAMKHRMNLSDLAALNPGVDWVRLSVGQEIRVRDGN
jgi:LysM repeat protein